MWQLSLLATLMASTSQVCVGDIRNDVGDFATNEPDTPLPLGLLWTADCRSLTACAASCMGDPNAVSFTVKPATNGHRQCRCYAYSSLSSEKLQDGASLYHLRRRMETVKQDKLSLSGAPLSTINTPAAADSMSATAIITTEPTIPSIVSNTPTTTAIITSTSIPAQINTTSGTGNNMPGAGTSNSPDMTSASSTTDTTSTTINNIPETTTSSLTQSASSTTLTTDTTSTTINNIPETTTSASSTTLTTDTTSTTINNIPETTPSASSTTLTTDTTSTTINNIPKTTTSSLTSGASSVTTTTPAATNNIPTDTTTSQTTTTPSATTTPHTVPLSTATTMTTSTRTTASNIVASWKGPSCFLIGGCSSVPNSMCVLAFCVCVPPYFYNSLTAACVIPT